MASNNPRAIDIDVKLELIFPLTLLKYISLQTLADPTAVLLLSMFLLASSSEVTETASEVEDQDAVASE